MPSLPRPPASRARPLADRWGGAIAARFRLDPRRPFDEVLEAVASYLSPEDVLLDVGGGAGRLSLPLAGRCRAVVNVEPPPGMAAAFRDAAREAAITNARAVESDWFASDETGDLAVVAHVTYFVREIVPFLEKLNAAARKRILVILGSVPPPGTLGAPYRALFDEPAEPAPGQRELLPVLWDMGILPDVRVLPSAVPPPTYPTREAAVAGMLHAVSAQTGVDLSGDAGSRDRLAARFDDAFQSVDGGYRMRPAGAIRTVLIAWTPGA
jgi:SAM-dependent methyltransferase